MSKLRGVTRRESLRAMALGLGVAAARASGLAMPPHFQPTAVELRPRYESSCYVYHTVTVSIEEVARLYGHRGEAR